MPLSDGQTICSGKYEVLRSIGEGGQSRVWLAREVKRDLEVAVKEPLPVLSSREREDVEMRFQREMRISGLLLQLDVPNVVRVWTVEKWKRQTLLVMEYCRGGSLAERLQHGTLPVDDAVRVSLEVCAALEVVHSKLRLVHRDIKPSNILFTVDGHARLGDLGLAQTGESGRSRLSGAGHPGSPGYMSPEQERQSGYLAPASDLYSLGCVLFEMVTGVQYQRQRPGTTASGLCPDAPAWLDGVLSRVLQEDPWQRYASAGEMAQALRAGLEERARGQAEASRQAEERARAEAQALAEAEQKVTQARLEEETRRQEAKDRAQAEARARAEEEGRRGAAEQKAMQALLEEEARRKEAEARAKAEDQARAAEERRRRAGRWRAWAWASAAIVAVALVLLGARGRGPLAPLFGRPRATATIATTHEPAAEPTQQPTVAPAQPGRPTFTSPPTPTAGPAEPQAGATRELEKAGITLLYVPAGEFWMGSADSDSMAWSDEERQHAVYLDSYWIGQTEVTNAQYRRFVEAEGYLKREYWTDASWQWKESNGITQPGYWNDAQWNHPDYPVVGVSWYEAVAYAEWAGARLPTEAEWEKAARGTDGRLYPWGNDWDGTRLNFCDKNCEYDWKDSGVDDGYAYTAPVGHYPWGASLYGAVDMAGNVNEWTADRYDKAYYARTPSRNPTGPDSGAERVLRGGAWLNIQRVTRCACRGSGFPGSYAVGFRVAE